MSRGNKWKALRFLIDIEDDINRRGHQCLCKAILPMLEACRWKCGFFFFFFFSDCSKQVRVLQRDLILFFFQIFNTKSTSQKAFASTCHA